MISQRIRKRNCNDICGVVFVVLQNKKQYQQKIKINKNRMKHFFSLLIYYVNFSNTVLPILALVCLVIYVSSRILFSTIVIKRRSKMNI